MTTATAERAVGQEFRLVPLDAIEESKTNPRRTFEPKAMEDLTASVKEKGVIVPILVRPMKGGTRLELVAGARRFRAAKKAGLTEIPAIIRSLSDDAALEAQVIENLQRADIHPLEEADGYRALLNRGKKVEDLAAKVGKSISYLWQRLKLLELIEPAKKAFLEEQLTAGHAILLARLQPQDQHEALRQCFGQSWVAGQHQKITIGVRGLQHWIQNNIILSLDGAPWRKDDAELSPAAGPCTTCPKRSGNAPGLWPEISRAQICTDRGCYQAKLKAWSLHQKKELEAKGERVELISDEYNPDGKGVLGCNAWQLAAKNKKRCPETVKGVFAEGDEQGKIVDICLGESCRIHRQRTSEYHGPKRSASEQKERAKEILKERATEKARLAILGEVLKATKTISRADIELVALGFERYVYMPYELTEAEFAPIEVNGPDDCRKASDKDLARYVIAAALTRELRLNEDPNLLYAAAKRHGIDIKAIERKALEQVVYDRAHKDRMQRWKGLKASGNTRFEIMTCQLCGRTEKDQAKGGWHWIRKNDKNKTALCNDCERLEKK